MPDAFGLKIGGNASVAAGLAARPGGTTMGEIADITGDTAYDLFRRLEAKGHFVRREGNGRSMHIWLRHKDQSESEGGDENAGLDAAELNGEELVAAEPERWTLSFERDLQRALRGCLENLELGLAATDGGREDGRRDITARDSTGGVVVIELKAVKAGPDAVAQLLGYMGELKLTTNPPGLRGILVAPDFHPKTVAAAAVVPNIALKRYSFHLAFADA